MVIHIQDMLRPADSWNSNGGTEKKAEATWPKV
jgi:hypothetical protein